MADNVYNSMPVNPMLNPMPFNPGTTSPLPSIDPNGPNLQTYLDNLRFGGENKFNLGQQTLAPTAGLTPEIQSVLDMIRKNTSEARTLGESNAQALAVRRGLPGSSVEQFGVAQAGTEAEKAGRNAEVQILLEDAKRKQDMKDKQAEAYFQRAQQEGTLTSDEVASLRNMYFANRSLDLQKYLGERGLDISAANIEAQADANKQNAQYGLASTLLGASTPYLLSKFFGAPGAGGAGTGGGGGLFNFLGGGSTSTGVALPGGGGAPASSLFPGGIGPVGTATPSYFGAGGSLLNTAGTSSFGAGSILPGLGGYYLGTRAFPSTQEGDQAAMNVGGAIGGIGGSVFGPAGTAAGAFLGTAYGKGMNRAVKGIEKSLGGTAGSIARYSNPFTGVPAVTKKVSKTVKKIFPF